MIARLAFDYRYALATVAALASTVLPLLALARAGGVL